MFDRWSEEDGDLELEAEFRVDENGFYIYWKSEGRDGDVLDLSQVCRLLILKSSDYQTRSTIFDPQKHPRRKSSNGQLTRNTVMNG